ncbi:hypothetical protein VDGL01_12092 [Verticillium dahliae]
MVGIDGFVLQLAVESAHQSHTDIPGTSVSWVHGSITATLE